MKALARRDGGEYVLSGSKTFITNGPYADTIVFICQARRGQPARGPRKIVQFVLDAGMGPGAVKPLRKMGMHSSPDRRALPRRTCVGSTAPRRDRGPTRGPAGVRASRPPSARSAPVVAMALGIVERVPGAVGRHAPTTRPVRSAHRRLPAHPAEAGQDGGRRMNLQNQVFRHIEMAAEGRARTFARGIGGQALRHAGRHGGGARGRPDLRRQRLHGRVRGRTARP